MKPTLYKTILDFGKVDAEMRGAKRNRVTVEIELRGTMGPARELTSYGKLPEDLELSICGNVWNARGSDIIQGGQCYDELLEIAGTPLMHEIVGVWKRWHLNGMNAGCEHQREWPTSKELTVYEYSRTTEMSDERRELKEQAIDAALNGEAMQLDQHQKDVLRSEYFVKSHLAQVPEGYKHYKTETNRAGHTRPTEHPDGLLGKPCDVCGYKYGTAWKHEALPREIVNQIMGWEKKAGKVAA